MKVLIGSGELQNRIRELAEELIRDYPNGVVLIGVLKGAFLFLSDLIRYLPNDYPVVVDFIQVASYHGGTSSSGFVKFLKDIDYPVEGRDVVLVEDIVDTGLTIHRLMELFRARHPKTLRVMTLLSKPANRKVDVPVHYVGFEIPPEFVVGYGLDYREFLRNLPYIAVMEESDIDVWDRKW